MVTDTTALIGLIDHGQIVIGDHGFEFYHARSPRKLVQIPWGKVGYVLASVVFKGRWIPRYAIQTKKDGTYTFVSKEPKRVLRAIRGYVGPDHMVRPLGFFDVAERGILLIGKKKK